MNVLISLHKGYGLGDAVQMSAVLRHVVAARPNWHIDYQAEEGKHQVGRDIVAATFAYGQSYPSPHYDAEVQICLYDTWANWQDRPNTRVSSCLHERFGLEWDRRYSCYQVNVTDDAMEIAGTILVPNWRAKWSDHGGKSISQLPKKPMVAIHYQGDSSPSKKNLTHEQASCICDAVEKLGRTPILLDWRNSSPLVKHADIRSVGCFPQKEGMGGNAEINCAIISQCEAFVGIDSGPSKCASATDTPALVIWTGHHPAPFHDPAPNTTHLVPTGYHGLDPVCNDPGVIKWFEANHSIRQYENKNPIPEIRQWLREILI